MSTPTWGLDPKARRISVYYTGSNTIYEGMPVCYEFDTTTNWMGVDGSKVDFTTTASTSGLESTTTAEGNQNEGKFIRVQDPDADNIQAFAGVVAGADHAGETGPIALDIYIPNGAIVPVRTDLNCTVGRTVLAVHTAEQMLTSPHHSAARPIAVAWETVDRSLITGIVLAKLDPSLFLYQKGDAAAIIVDDQDATSALTLNHINATFANTSGINCALWVQATTTGGGGGGNGYGLAAYFEADVSATPVASQCPGVGIWMNLTGGTVDYAWPLEVGLYETGSTVTSSANVAVISLTSQVASTVNAGHQTWMYLQNNGVAPDAVFYCNSIGDLPMTTASSVTTSHKIAIASVAGTVYYVAAGTTTS